MNLFRTGDFTLHGGQKSLWKIDCDALACNDWRTIALMISEILPPFGTVEGIPRGGISPSMHLRDYARCQCGHNYAQHQGHTHPVDFPPPTHCSAGCGCGEFRPMNLHLIVDDVLTTGGSMEIARHNYLVANPGSDVLGAVVFARGPCPDWITPLFRVTPPCKTFALRGS